MYDPADHTNAEVLEYLAGADDEEKARVFELERSGQARSGILETAPYDPADHTVPEVLKELAKVDDEERGRILQAERDGKARSGILSAEEPEAEEESDLWLEDVSVLAGAVGEFVVDSQTRVQELREQHQQVFADADGSKSNVIVAMRRLTSVVSDLSRALAAVNAVAGDLDRSANDA
jgi:hypothetical protein